MLEIRPAWEIELQRERNLSAEGDRGVVLHGLDPHSCHGSAQTQCSRSRRQFRAVITVYDWTVYYLLLDNGGDCRRFNSGTSSFHLVTTLYKRSRFGSLLIESEHFLLGQDGGRQRAALTHSFDVHSLLMGKDSKFSLRNVTGAN